VCPPPLPPTPVGVARIPPGVVTSASEGLEPSELGEPVEPPAPSISWLTLGSAGTSPPKSGLSSEQLESKATTQTYDQNRSPPMTTRSYNAMHGGASAPSGRHSVDPGSFRCDARAHQ